MGLPLYQSAVWEKHKKPTQTVRITAKKVRIYAPNGILAEKHRSLPAQPG
jgi:hypothetical protein